MNIWKHKFKTWTKSAEKKQKNQIEFTTSG